MSPLHPPAHPRRRLIRPHLLAALLLVFNVSSMPVRAEDDGHFPETATQAAAQPVNEMYTPGLGEFMLTIQLHHAKLWFAGKSGNWSLATYELDEINETFDDAAHWTPTWQGHPIARLIHPMTSPALMDLHYAIVEHNPARFRHAFDQLSNACSACHTATGHDYIVIQRPDFPPLTNQRFMPNP